MTDIYLHFRCAHYRLYGNAPVGGTPAKNFVCDCQSDGSVYTGASSPCGSAAVDWSYQLAGRREAIDYSTGAWQYNRPCAQEYVGKYQSCMVISGRLYCHALVDQNPDFDLLYQYNFGAEYCRDGFDVLI